MAGRRSFLADVDPRSINFSGTKRSIEGNLKRIYDYKPAKYVKNANRKPFRHKIKEESIQVKDNGRNYNIRDHRKSDLAQDNSTVSRVRYEQPSSYDQALEDSNRNYDNPYRDSYEEDVFAKPSRESRLNPERNRGDKYQSMEFLQREEPEHQSWSSSRGFDEEDEDDHDNDYEYHTESGQINPRLSKDNHFHIHVEGGSVNQNSSVKPRRGQKHRSKRGRKKSRSFSGLSGGPISISIK